MAASQRQEAPPQFRIGAKVVARDGAEGSVQRVVVDPDTGEVVALVLDLGSWLTTRSVVLPVDRIERTDADHVWVNMTSEDVESLPDFEEVRYVKPDEAWKGLPGYTPDAVLFWSPRTAVEAFVPPTIVPEPNMEVVRNVPAGTIVLSGQLYARCGEHVVGHVDRVLVDEREERATHLVIRSGLLGNEEHIVPVSQVREVTETTVELECHGNGLDEFPRYRG